MTRMLNARPTSTRSARLGATAGVAGVAIADANEVVPTDRPIATPRADRGRETERGRHSRRAHDRDHPLLTELVSAAKGSRQRLRTSLPRSRNQVRGEQPGMRIATVAVAITGAVAGVVAPVYAHPDNLAAPAGVVTLKATLTGTYVHAPAGGRGTAAITFAGNRVCWKFTFKGIGTPTISGIHKAPPPPAGVHKTAIVPFTANTTMQKGCAAAKAGAVKVVLANPSAYYVSIGTSGKYRFAAIGGRLHRR